MGRAVARWMRGSRAGRAPRPRHGSRAGERRAPPTARARVRAGSGVAHAARRAALGGGTVHGRCAAGARHDARPVGDARARVTLASFFPTLAAEKNRKTARVSTRARPHPRRRRPRQVPPPPGPRRALEAPAEPRAPQSSSATSSLHEPHTAQQSTCAQTTSNDRILKPGF